MSTVSRILLPIDFSPGSLAAVDMGALMASTFGASLTLLHVAPVAGGMAGIVPGASIELDIKDDVERTERELSAILAGLRERGIAKVEMASLVGAPGPTILSRAQDGGFDLIIMGTHGRTGLSHLVMGSVAEHVVRLATCPVLTIHMPAGARLTLAAP